ncbi:hypothetical protein Tsubulata_040376 [Turnera subulata]|uniref:Histone deacetylase interacting domain-containing protein n=1 Tax=Turnera subulata TaxID=218843 RepID=A0A9Q0FHJ5_9ROSI|nr:hypothetical protein Tsubulata_040376 [Turnera subulata]
MTKLLADISEEKTETVYRTSALKDKALLYLSAQNYVKQVRDRFANHPARYKDFTDVMQTVMLNGWKSHKDFLARIKEVLVGHDDLIAGINIFIPRPNHPDDKYENNEEEEEENEEEEEEEEEEEAHQGSLYRTAAYRVAVDFTDKIRVLGDRVFHPFNDALRSYKKQRISLDDACVRVLTALEEHPDLQMEFCGTFMPYCVPAGGGSRRDSDLGSDASTGGDHAVMRREVGKKVKKENLDGEISNGDYNDEERMSDLSEQGFGSDARKQGLRFFDKVEQKLGPEVKFGLFKVFYYYELERIGEAEFKGMVSIALEDCYDLVSEFKCYFNSLEKMLGSATEDGNVQGRRHMDRKRDKYKDMPIYELDLSNCKKASPGYRLLPEDYPISTPKNRDEIGAEVLNDHWVSVPSATEVSSGKKYVNRYEKRMSRCEDNRYEMDMLETQLKSAVRYAEELLEEFDHADHKTEGTAGDSSYEDEVDGIKIEGHTDDDEENVEEKINAEEDPEADAKGIAKNLRQKHFLRCVERLYGDQGLEVLHLFHKDARSALPSLLSRLNQKLEELKVCRPHYESKWKDACKRC